MLLIRCYQAAGLFPKDFEGGAYSQHWHLHRSEEHYLEGIQRLSHPVPTPGIGDLILFRFGRTVSHAAIYIGDEKMIHATAEEHQVSVSFVSQYAQRLYGYFSVFPVPA